MINRWVLETIAPSPFPVSTSLLHSQRLGLVGRAGHLGDPSHPASLGWPNLASVSVLHPCQSRADPRMQVPETEVYQKFPGLAHRVRADSQMRWGH